MQTLTTLLEQNNAQEALALFARQPMDAEESALLLKYARSWHTKGLLDEQRRACEAVLAYDKTNAEAWHLLGFYAQCQGDFAAAEKYYSRALTHQSDFAFSQLALSQIQMLRSHFHEGRTLYESRFAAVTEKSGADWRGLPIPRWHGESLAGKSIYLWEEQGLGDIIMFASLLPFILQQSPARVTLGINAQLLPLFARSFPQIHVEPIEQVSNHVLGAISLQMYPQYNLLKSVDIKPLEAAYEYTLAYGTADYAAPLGDLLVYALPDFIPAQQGYLKADPQRKEAFTSLLRPLSQGKRLIGISWHTSNARELLRNIPLESWLPLLTQPDCFFISLQHHVAREEVQQFCATHNCAIWQHTDDPTSNAEDLAALISVMDHVITIDNSNAHLAGALGIPTTLLLPKGHNFRWPELKDGSTLWYKNVTTIRQQCIGKWDEFMHAAAP